MTGHHFRPQSSLSSPIHAVKPSLSFKVVNYIVHCLLPKTIKPTLWTSRDFSQSVSNIGLYNLWQGGIFTNFSLAYIPVSQSHTLFLGDSITNIFPTWQTRSREVRGGKSEKKRSQIFLFSLSLCLSAKKQTKKQTNVA